MAGVTIEVLAAPQLNHAMAHNGLPFLHRIVVASTSPLSEILVSARVVDAFGTVLSRPWQHFAERLDPGVPLAIEQPAVRPDPAYLAGVEEETAAEIVVEVAAGGTSIASGTHPIRVLAARQWVLDPASPVLSLELLAAFVQPNHPALSPLISEAARLLADATGSGSLGVHYAEPERIDEIVAAVFTAVHDRQVFYAEPPASWGYGQKVRTPGDVLTDRVGTCLDTTLLLASALEHVGVTPVLWMALGHAFLGYWREPEHGLPDAATTQVAVPANAVDLELMGVLETTMVTRERRPPRDLVRRARQAPRDHYFLGGTSELLGVVDIGMARMLHVYPLPARRERADGVVEVIEYVPPAQPSTPPGSSAGTADAPVRTRPAAEPVPPRVQAWKNALLDLTLRNKLLNLRQPMTQVPLLLPPEHLGALADQLQDGRTVSVRAVDDLTGAVVTEGAGDAYALPADVQRAMLVGKSTIYSGHARGDHERAFARLRYRARTGREETGANPLMLTLGRLDWELGDRKLAAPLLLLPVDIKGVVMPFRLAADPAGAVSVNLSLLEKLRVEFGFTVPGLDELPTRADGEGVDVGAAIKTFREAIAASGLAFRVESEARLIIGGFTGFLLWRDLDEHWERFVQRPLVRQLLDGRITDLPEPDRPTRAALDDPAGVARLDGIVAAAPIPADGSQAQAIAAARAGQSFVLEGPPGTGKSQTITNILADQMTQGRRVMFVAEKGAALDVVRHRLGEIGLLPYALDLHDHNARPAEVRARLKTALAQRVRPDLDGYRAALGEVEGSASGLRTYAERLHRPNRAGLSLWSARATALARGTGPSLTVSPAVLGDETDDAGPGLDELRRVVVGATGDLAVLDPETVLAWGFVGGGPEPVDQAGLIAALPAAEAALACALSAADSSLPGSRELLRQARDWQELTDLSRLLSAVGSGDVLAELTTARWSAARAELSARTAALQQSAGTDLADFAPTVLDVDLEPVRQALRVAQASFFLGRKGRLVAAAAPVLAHLRPGRTVPPKELPARVDRLAGLAGQHAALLQSWQALPGIGWLPPLNLLAPEGADRLAHELSVLDAHRDAFGRLEPSVTARVLTVRRDEPPLAGPVQAALTEALARMAPVLAAARSRVLDQRAYGGTGLLAAWNAGSAARSADLPNAGGLRRWVRAAAAVDALAADLPEARWQLLAGEVPSSDAVAALERGLAQGSQAERWEAGGFRAFDAGAQDRSIGRFLSGSDAVRSALTTVLPGSLIDARPFGTGTVFGRVGALEREIGRTRGGLSVRSLISTYGEVISAITPCVLVSPDSLARFIAPDAMEFDLVVFDEASQITVPDAIGALGRAAACVVAGDSKQMPPYSFAQLGSDDEVVDTDRSDFLLVPDEESILSECVQAGLPRLWLSWHYRSRDESLISFSNAQYYEGRLSSFPAFPGQALDTGISFTRVPGTFLRSGRKGTDKGLVRTNPVEATAVVEEVLRRWRQRERSIGVVTFNIQQRALIERMLWDSDVDGVREALALKDDGLFVKNLENVQGDERDVIVFSTGFSVGEDGVLPLNFGPLNRSGGERRLNVAVTRARRRVMVFSSFEPEDLRTEQTSSVGIQHLRAYLEQAKHGAPARARSEVAVDRHAEQIAAALRAAGCVVQTEVGLSEFLIDLAVAAPGRGETPTLAVLLDGPAWAARVTTGDRDGAPVSVLSEIMGWPGIARVWLPAWLSDPDAVVRDLVARAQASSDVTRAVGESEASTTWATYQADETRESDPREPEPANATLGEAADAVTTDDFSGSTGSDGSEPYRESELGPFPAGVLERLDDDAGARQRVAELMAAIIAESGPISVERLGRRVVRAYGRTRLVNERRAQVRALLSPDVRRDREEGFVWPAERDPRDWTGFRTSDDLKVRPLADIALVEIANAMAHVAAQAMGIGEDELFRQTYKLFGGNRLTEPARERLAAALSVGVARERLAVRGEVVTAIG
ncbi:DUF4011 domain-containing protein [Microlunatus ginsengisoli]|uniref:DUF4011 domain-containing protein n=1 Tax=Microlunatus ginsengisoli TaxID=363863 RepID=UPI0031D270AC